MFVIVITCAINVSCGLSGELRHHNPQPSIEQCRAVARLGIALAHADEAKFVIKCERVAP